MRLDSDFGLLRESIVHELLIHEEDKILVYRRGPLLFAVNLHPTQSQTELRIPAPASADYRTVLSTDEKIFAGHGRATSADVHPIHLEAFAGQDRHIRIYLPSRVGVALAPIGR
jgi:1,4-alpha-glucan branching enzyme